jgi:hypothetical protein
MVWIYGVGLWRGFMAWVYGVGLWRGFMVWVYGVGLWRGFMVWVYGADIGHCVLLGCLLDLISVPLSLDRWNGAPWCTLRLVAHRVAAPIP